MTCIPNEMITLHPLAPEGSPVPVVRVRKDQIASVATQYNHLHGQYIPVTVVQLAASDWTSRFEVSEPEEEIIRKLGWTEAKDPKVTNNNTYWR